MTECDLDTSVPDWIIEHPGTLPIFGELGLDESCGGKSLAYQCQAEGLGPDTVLNLLLRTIDETRGGGRPPNPGA